MQGKEFSVGALVKAGWRSMKDHVWFFIGFLILYLLIPAIPYGVAGWYYGYTFESQLPPIAHISVAIVHAVLAITVIMGLLKVALALSVNEKVKWGYLFNCFPKVITFFLAELFYLIIVAVGLVLLVFPGVIWGVRYVFFGFFIVDKGVGPIEALKLSAAATKGAKWDVFALILVTYVIELIGLLCLVVGLFAAIPTVVIARAIAYRKLTSQLPS